MLAPAGNAFAFGALAVGGSRTGYSYNFDSPEAAGARAVQECGAGCRVVTTFQGCAAYASGRGRQATGIGGSRGAAQSSALAQCLGCSIRVWACESGGMRQTRNECGDEQGRIKAHIASVDRRQKQWWSIVDNYSGGETASLCAEGKELRAHYLAMPGLSRPTFTNCAVSSNAAVQSFYRQVRNIAADVQKGLRKLRCH